MLWRTAGAECGALLRLPETLKHKAADALARLFDSPFGHSETTLGVEVGVLLRKRQSALRDFADAAPPPVHNSKNLRDELLRRPVSAGVDCPGVRIFYFGAPFLELRHAAMDAVKNIQRFKSRDYNRHTVLACQRLSTRRNP
jgi:hypothetical protein